MVMSFLLVPLAYGALMITFNIQEDQELKRVWKHHDDWKQFRERRHLPWK